MNATHDGQVRIVGSPLGFELWRRVIDVSGGVVSLRGSDGARTLRFDSGSGAQIDGAFAFDARIHPDDLARVRSGKVRAPRIDAEEEAHVVIGTVPDVPALDVGPIPSEPIAAYHVDGERRETPADRMRRMREART